MGRKEGMDRWRGKNGRAVVSESPVEDRDGGRRKVEKRIEEGVETARRMNEWW